MAAGSTKRSRYHRIPDTHTDAADDLAASAIHAPCGNEPGISKQVYQNTANDFATVQKYFMENPEYRLYFYEGKGLDVSDPEYLRVSAIAEFFLHAVHNLTIHRRYMQEYPWHVWERSLRDIYNKSPILQQFLHEHPDWYTDEVHRILTGRSSTHRARPSS